MNHPPLLSRFCSGENRFQEGSGSFCDLPWCPADLETSGSTRGWPIDLRVRPVPSTLGNYKEEKVKKSSDPFATSVQLFSGVTVIFLGALGNLATQGSTRGTKSINIESKKEGRKEKSGFHQTFQILSILSVDLKYNHCKFNLTF